MSDDGAANGEERPRIDLSPALGEAGHEVEELGYEGIPDTGPLVGEPDPADCAGGIDDALDSAANGGPTV